MADPLRCNKHTNHIIIIYVIKCTMFNIWFENGGELKCSNKCHFWNIHTKMTL